MKLEKLYTILEQVLKGKVFYGVNVYDDENVAEPPYIVYQEISKRPIGYSDDKAITYRKNVQITLVTKQKNLALEEKLEKTLEKNELVYQMINEGRNGDKSINRVYEIKMEEF